MKQVFYIILTSLVIGLPIEQAAGITTYGGNGLVRVQSANNVYRGALLGTINMDYTQTSGSYTFRDGTGAINLLYGVRHYFEIGLSQTIYQDRAFAGTGPEIGPLRISLKGALPTNAPSYINLGAQILLSLPTGGASDVEWESYISPNTSIGGMIILSFDSNPIDLDHSRRLHINAGFIYHNDKNEYADPEDPTTLLNTTNTSQAIFGAGLQMPLRENIQFFSELTAEYFIDINPLTLIAREGSKIPTYIRLTPGLRVQHGRFSMLYGLELRAFSSGKLTAYDNQSIYPRWRAITNLQYRIFEGVPPTFRRGRSMRISGSSYYQYGRGGDLDPLGIGHGVIQNLEERQELLDQVEEELGDIRQQRIKAQRELEEMKKSMEEDPG
jgi:hypothetical protein